MTHDPTKPWRRPKQPTAQPKPMTIRTTAKCECGHELTLYGNQWLHTTTGITTCTTTE